MGVCNCSLAGTKACETCPNNGNSIRFSTVVWPQNVQVYGDDAYQRGLSEGRKQGLREAVAILKTNRGKPCTDLNVDWHEGYDDALDWGIDAIEATMKEDK